MKRSSKLLALLLAVVMCVGVLSACNSGNNTGNTNNNSGTTNNNTSTDNTGDTAEPANDTLVVSVEKGL